MQQANTIENRSSLAMGSPLPSISVRRSQRINLKNVFGRLDYLLSQPQNRALLFALSLLAFEVFSLSTTRFALGSLLGAASFSGARWATILAIALCAVDFAGLIYLFGPERDATTGKEALYLTGAWLIGATMGALMVWWAISLTVLNFDSGILILNRADTVTYIPILVAAAVWFIRVLFIGVLSSTGH